MHLRVRDVADRRRSGWQAQVVGQRQVAVREDEGGVRDSLAQQLEAGNDDVEVVQRRRRPRAEDQRALGWARRRAEPLEVHAEVDHVQLLRRDAPRKERAPHVLGPDEHGVGVDAQRFFGEVDVRAPRGRDDRAVRDLGRDPAPPGQVVGLDQVGLEAIQDVAQPRVVRLVRVVDRRLLRHIVEVDRAPVRLEVACGEDLVPQPLGVLRPALRVPDVERAELQDPKRRLGDQAS